MLRRIFTTGIAGLIICINAIGQVELSKKEITESLEQISMLVINQDYEQAINTLFSNKQIIKEENVGKKDLDKYLQLKKILENKIEDFNENQEKVERYVTSYYSLNFKDAFKLLDMDLSPENSYKKTRNTKAEVYDQLKVTKERCDANRKNLQYWQEKFTNEEYEDIYALLEVSNSIDNAFYPEDVIYLEDMQQQLSRYHKVYEEISTSAVSAPKQTISAIDYSNLSVEESEEFIKTLNLHLVDIKTADIRLSGKHPLLEEELRETQSAVENEIMRLLEHAEMLRPLSHSEIENKIFDTQEDVSYSLLEEYFTPITDAEILELGSIYNTDVFTYYELVEYNTEAKKNEYKYTDEYLSKAQYLKQLKRESDSTFYMLTLNAGENKQMLTKGGYGGKYAVEYDKEKGGIYINLGAYNKADGGLPKVYRKRFEMSSIPVEKFKAFNEDGLLTEDDNFYRQMTFLEMDYEEGMTFQKNIHKIDIIALFNIDDVQTRQVFKMAYYSDYYVAKIRNVRLLAINRETKEIYFQKSY